jgi:flagella basal body P-ring formation protein FlgA
MCDAVPDGDAIASIGRGGGGKLLPLIGNTRPRRERSLGNGRYAAVIDRRAAHFSVRNPAPSRGTAIAPVLIMNCMHKSTLRLILLALPAIAAAVTGPVADLAALQSAAEHAVRHEIPPSDSNAIVRVQNLDGRLRLAECDRPLTAAISGDGQVRAHTTVAVRCEGTVHWTIYMSVTIDSEFTVLVARHAIARDAELTATDFELMPRHLPGLTTDYVTQPAMIAGQRLRKTIAGGEALSLDALTPSNAIHRGQQVTLIAGAGGFEVRMSAVALTDGRIADRIRVQNLSSQRVVEGIVRSDSVVEVPL